jgi:hypothetical protein
MKKVFFVIAAAFSVAAHADTYEGKTLAQGISSYEKIEKNQGASGDYIFASQLMGYVAGVADVDHSLGKICLPRNTTPKQQIAIVSKYYNNHPEKWSDAALAVVEQAFAEAFPCKK